MLNINTVRPLRTFTASVSGQLCRTSTRLRHVAALTVLRQTSKCCAAGGCPRPAATRNASLMMRTETICIHAPGLSNTINTGRGGTGTLCDTVMQGRNVRLETVKSAVFIDVYEVGAGGGTRTHTTFLPCLLARIH